jgi:FkbM family methyltransferase
MTFGSTPQGPLTSASGKVLEVAKAGGQRAWRWLSAPWTWSASQTAHFVDQGAVGQQIRNLDGRAQVHGAAIEIISAQINDIARDQGHILKLLDRQTDLFTRLDASLGRLAEIAQETQSVRQDLTSTRHEFADGVRQVQLTLAQEAASTRARLASLPSTEQVQGLIGQGSSGPDLVAARAQISSEIQRVHDTLVAQTADVQARLATLPSTEHVHTLIGGGMVVDELAAARQELAHEIRTVHTTLAQVTQGLHDRLASLPSADQVHAAIDTGLAKELTAAKTQLAEANADMRERIAALPSAADVHALVGETVVKELASVRAEAADEAQKVRQALAALPSAEQIEALLGGGMVAQQIQSTRAQVVEGLQKVQQVLAEQTAGLNERLAGLPSTEQIHAFVEGGAASSIQSARRLFSEETQRAHAATERVARKLEFLQSRNVVPLPAQGLVMCRNPLGFLAVPADDLATIGSLADGVLPEQGTLKVVEKYLKPGGIFVDVGANVGLFSLLAARIVGPSGKVVAIEPAPAAVQALRATVDANGLGGIVTVKAFAAGAEQGLGTLSVAQNSTHSSLLPGDTAASTVVATVAPLDDALDGMLPDMVKIDVEGFEANVIEGMKTIFRANPDVIVIMVFEPAHIRSTGLSAASWVERLRAAGLDIFEIDERTGELAPLRKTGLEEIVSVNVLIARGDPSRRSGEQAGDTWLRLGSGAQALAT